MATKEPRVTQLRKALLVSFILAGVVSNAGAADQKWFEKPLASSHFQHLLIGDLQNAIEQTGKSIDELVIKAQTLVGKPNLVTLIRRGSVDKEFQPKNVVGDSFSTTIRLTQKLRGIEVIGGEALVHFSPKGDLQEVNKNLVDDGISTAPSLSSETVQKIIRERYQQNVEFSLKPTTKVFKDFTGRTRLIFEALTKTSTSHAGKRLFVDAQNGELIAEMPRAFDLDSHLEVKKSASKRKVYSADTDKAKQNTDPWGYPTDLNLAWYDLIKDGKKTDKQKVDRSALNAYRNAGLVYDYYLENFNRKSYDDKDSELISIVHIGEKMNNAFWTDEFGVMAYGDGDGEHLRDLTYGIDVAAHEMTHGVTSRSADLVYAAESGALNESYSDFFGKMVDYTENDWDIGRHIMAKQWGRRALRNMMFPTEFDQPDSNDSNLKVPTTGQCNPDNDMCGVHSNSGIPNRAAALIVEAIGKEKTEQIYYKVLTSRLTSSSGFKEAKEETVKVCELMFKKDSEECNAVRSAFATVKM